MDFLRLINFPYIILPFLYYIYKYGIKTIINTFNTNAKSLGVIGMQGSGKTQLYNTLKDLGATSYEATPVKDYDNFTFTYNGRKLTIKQGRDIGGGEEYIHNYYEEWMKDKDIIIMIFDAKKYIDSNDYRRHTNARLDFIWRKSDKLREQYKNVENNISQNGTSNFLLIGSHFDLFKKKELKSLLKDFQSIVSGKPYENLFHKNFMLLDLRDSNAVKQEISKLF